jgi:glycosyltransferase involved in cell wall biosynthesis
MKILIVSTITGCSWAGTEEVWYQFAKYALSQGHQVMLAADVQICYSDQVGELQHMGLLVSKRRMWRPARLYLAKQKIRHDHFSAIKWCPDICLINAGSPLDLEYSSHLSHLIQVLCCKKVFFCHFNSDRLAFAQREKTIKQIQGMDLCVFVNHANHRQLEAQLALSLPNSKVILNSSRLQLEAPLPFPKLDNIAFANVARLETYWKGQDILLETMHSDAWKSREWSLEFFGSGQEESYIKRLISHYSLSTKVRIAGYERSVSNIWQDRHVLLLPSKGEGTPLVAVEAMMCGRPVVTTDVGGNAEIIEDGVTGWIAEAATTRSFGKTLERAWAERHRWEEMGRAAHENAKELAQANPSATLLTALELVVLTRQ